MPSDVSSSLYSGFTLTTENCHEEPIHRPLAIQGTGHLLAFDPGMSRLLAASDSVSELFGVSDSMLWVRGLEPLPQKLLADIKSEVASDAAATGAGSPPRWVADTGEFQVICHQSHGVWIAELEELTASGLTVDSCLAFDAALDDAMTTDHLFQLVAVGVRKLLGYDRVMVYRLDREGHGEVVGEDLQSQLEPFLGLRYPATDIPPMARTLFLESGPRSIPDIDLPNSWLRFSPDWPRGRELDLSRAQLRATSPIHLEYLANMGVQATLSIPLVLDGELWGLIACHHQSPRNPSYGTRRVARLLARSMTRKLLELQATERRERLALNAGSRRQFIDAVTVEDGYGLLLLLNPAILQEMCSCDGAAVISLGRPGATIGVVPSEEELGRLAELLAKRSGDGQPLLVTDSIRKEHPELFGPDSPIGGLLAVRVSNQADNHVVWFRQTQRRTVNWAGDPNQPQLQQRVDEQGQIHLSPRASFAKWEGLVEDRSAAWDEESVAGAVELRREVISLESERAAEIVSRRTREFEILMSAASHDLEQPLRTQRGFLQLIEEELADGADGPTLVEFVGRASEAVTRMQELVEDLLDYGRLGGEVIWEPVDLNEVVAEILADRSEEVFSSAANIEVGELPVIRADRNRCRRLFGNLIGNGLKYVEPGQAPEVRIWCQRAAEALIINVEDRGIGVDPADHQKIFEIFTRLHRRDQYPGTGIGLAIAKRAVEDLHGSIGVDSVLGHGSTFWCRFHRAREVLA